MFHCRFAENLHQLPDPRIECNLSLVVSINSFDSSCNMFLKASESEILERKVYRDKAIIRKKEFKELNDLLKQASGKE